MSVTPSISFDDGAAYERMMGTWSRIAGSAFLDWLRPAAHLRWADVGCGNGAFTELLMQRCSPAAVTGVDPSSAQLAYARDRAATRGATYLAGDAMALPLPDAGFDAAVMALVLFFVPDPARGAAEMARVVVPGGLLCGYMWDIPGGGLPHEPLREEMRAMGLPVVSPPNADVSSVARLVPLLESAGWKEVDTTTLRISRVFADADDTWETSILGSTLRDQLKALEPAVREELKARVAGHCQPDAAGRVTWHATVTAFRGRRRASAA